VAVGLAVAGLALAVKHAYETSVPFRTAVQEMVAKLREFGQHVLAAGQALLTKLQPVIQGALKHLQEFASELGTRVGPALTNIFHFLQLVGDFVSTVFIAIWPTLKNVIAGVWQAIQGVIEVAWSIISGIFKVILDVIGGKWGQAWNDLLEMLRGVWDGILRLLGGLLPAIGSILGGLGQLLLNILGTAWNGIKAGIGNLLGAIGDFIGGKIHEWQMRFWMGVAVIQALLHAGFEKVKEIITAPIRFVVGLFKWLFDHNTYFHDLVIKIQDAFNNAKAFITGIWTTITTWLGDLWKRIQLDVQVAWVLIQAYIINPVKQAIATIQEKIGQVRDWIVGKWNEIKQDAQAAWDQFVSAITGVVDRVKTAISTVISNITTPIKNLATQALDWGQNLIKQFIQGIQNMAGKAGDAAKNVVGNVTKFLGFHSPAEEGPGADADKWAPRLMQMFAEGMESGTPAVASAASRAAQAVRNGLTSNGVLPYGAVGTGAGAAQAGGGGDVYVTVPLTLNIEADPADGSPETVGRAFGTSLGSAFGQALKTEMAQRGYRPG
jgi:phage-related protein